MGKERRRNKIGRVGRWDGKRKRPSKMNSSKKRRGIIGMNKKTVEAHAYQTIYLGRNRKLSTESGRLECKPIGAV